MDCEKFDSVMLDELYGELDEVTSAAAKRHLSGCARCSAAFAGLKATRRVATLPLVDPPDDLTSRVLAKTWEAQKVVPLKSRFTQFLSVAGSWAMRPQTAMAAVFLLMIGSSVLFLSSGRKAETATQSASQAFGGGGSPAPVAKNDEERGRLDYASAASAHGTEPLKQLMPQATATAAPTLGLDPAAGNDQQQAAPGQGQLALADENASSTNASAPLAGAGGGGATRHYANGPYANGPPPAVQAQTAGKAESKDSSDLEKGVNQYKDKKYDEAQKTLDGINGSPDAALWAARSVRDSQGCSAAIQRFEDLASRSWGTNAAYEATFDAAQCYEKMGNRQLAIARYSKLLSIPQWAAKAQNELDRLRPPSAKPAPAPRSYDQKANTF